MSPAGGEPAVDSSEVLSAQHARLLEGLAESIREKGLGQTQVSDIVRHAKASRRTFYNHFDDKDACLVELEVIMSISAMEQVAAAIDAHARIEDQIDAGIDTYLEILRADLALTVTFYSPALSERVVRAQREGMERYAELLASSVQAAAATDPLVVPVSLTQAFMLISGLAQTFGRAIELGDDLDDVATEIKQVIKQIVRSSDPVRAGLQ